MFHPQNYDPGTFECLRPYNPPLGLRHKTHSSKFCLHRLTLGCCNKSHVHKIGYEVLFICWHIWSTMKTAPYFFGITAALEPPELCKYSCFIQKGCIPMLQDITEISLIQFSEKIVIALAWRFHWYTVKSNTCTWSLFSPWMVSPHFLSTDSIIY